MAEVSTKTWFGHPRGLATLFFTEMWERFSYYGMRAILVLFMTTDVAAEGMGLDTTTAGAIYGLYTAGVYLLTLPGGWLADNIFGQRKAIWYGGIAIMTGHILLAVPGFVSGMENVFFLGLCFVAIGTGLLKPNISTIVGDLYPEKGATRDAGFSVFYMGINIGSLLGQTFVAYLGEKVDWHLGFGLAAVGMFFGLVQYYFTQNSLGDLGVEPKAAVERRKHDVQKSNSLVGFALAAVLIAFLAALQWLNYIDLTRAEGISDAVGIIIVSVTLFYFAYILFAGGLDTMEKKRVVVIFLLFVGAAIFWAGFEQAGSSLNLFARDFTNRMVGGWELPAGWLQNVNPALIVIFAPIIGAIWVKLAARNLNPTIPIKFGIGLVLMGLGFLVMVFAAQTVADANGGKVGMYWLVLTYFLHSTGELTLSPVGLSATTKLAPERYVGQMMGIWFVGASLGNLIAGRFAGDVDLESIASLPDAFMSVVYMGVGAGLFFLAFSKGIQKWIGNID